MQTIALIAYTVFSVAVLQYLAKWIPKQFRRRKTIQERGCRPIPAKKGSKFFGIDHVLSALKSVSTNSRNADQKAQQEQYGHTYETSLLGGLITEVSTIEPSNIQTVFAHSFEDWGVQPIRLFALEPFTGNGVMTADGPSWEHSRALLRPLFSKTNIADFSRFEIHVQRLLDLVPKDGSTVDMQPLFGKLSLDSSTEFLFGESVESLVAEKQGMGQEAKDFLSAYNYGQGAAGRRMMLPQYNIFTQDKRFWNSCDIAQRFVDKYVAAARERQTKLSNGGAKELDVNTESGRSRYILANELVKESNDDSRIRKELLNIFLPAHEASAVALTNIFFRLSRNPHVWNKLRDEVRSRFPRQNDLSSSDAIFERLKSLKYLQYVINETFRLHPAIGTLIRIALRDTVLPVGGGAEGKAPVFVREGDLLSTSLYALHRRKDIYGEDADDFRPERWETLRPPFWSYLPFSGGIRICPGQQLGLAEVSYATVRLAQAFDVVECRDPVKEFVEVYKISTESKNGAKVAFLGG